MVEQANLKAVEALKHQDVESAHRIYEDDHSSMKKGLQSRTPFLILIATQQPIARDLRLLAAMLEIITELERIGRLCKRDRPRNPADWRPDHSDAHV